MKSSTEKQILPGSMTVDWQEGHLDPLTPCYVTTEAGTATRADALQDGLSGSDV